MLSATPTAPRAQAYPNALRASRRTLTSQAPIASEAQLGPAHLHGSDALLGYGIHAGLGNLYLATTDIVAYPALSPQLVFERHYNSQGGDIDVGLGRGWTHSYAWRIAMPDPTAVQLLCDTGRTLLFKLARDGATWLSPIGEFGTLSGSEAEGFLYTNSAGTVFAFDSPAQAGRLLSISPADGTPITISYSWGSRIQRVVAGDLALVFTYDGDHIRSIVDPSGHTWLYDVSENLNAVMLPNVDLQGEHGFVRYLYDDFVANEAIFTAGDSASHITRIVRRQSSGVEIDAGLFSYDGDRLVRAASSALDGAFQRDLALSYGPAIDGQMTTTATLAGGSKQITLANIDGHWRITQIAATAGVGYEGAEWTSAQYQWNADLTLAAITDGNGVTTAFASYDARSNPQLIVEGSGSPLARATRLTYHPVLSRPLTISRLSLDGTSQHTITYDYDDDYDTSYNAAPTSYLHQIAETGATDMALTGTLSAAATATSRIFYDAQHRPTQLQAPNGASQQMGYWPAESGAQANRLQYVRATPANDRALTTTISAYDVSGRPSETSDPNGLITAVIYDPLGHLTSRTRFSGDQSLSEHYQYNLAGDITAASTSAGATLALEYDQAGRVWRRSATMTGSLGVAWSELVRYDDQNHAITMRRLRGLGESVAAACSPDDNQELCVERSYDSFGRLAGVRTLGSNDQACQALACTIAYAYDNNGNLARVTEAGVATTSYRRDELNRVIQIVHPTNVAGTVAYDADDNIVAYTDPRDALNGGAGANRTLISIYDDFGRLIAMRSPDAGLSIANYDAAGLLSRTKDALGNLMRYTYDGANRLVRMHAPAANDSLVYLYDEAGAIGDMAYANTAGRLSSVQARDSAGNRVYTHYSYDRLGRLAGTVEERGPNAAPSLLSFRYAWGDNGELAALTYPDGTTVRYQYAGAGGLRPMPSAVTTSFGGGELALVRGATYFADGVAREFHFGNGGIRRLARNQRGEWTHLVSGPADNPVVDQRYEYDAEGRGLLTAVHHFQGTERAWDWTYSYDLQNRLTGYSTNVRPTPDVYTWAYDEVGNRVEQTYNGATTTYHYPNPANNQLAALSGAETEVWAYNANGFVASHTTPERQIRYRYDTHSRLIGLVGERGQMLAAYSYDGAQHIAQRVQADGSSTHSYYSPSGVLLYEVADTGEQQNGDRVYEITNYVYLDTTEVARIVRKYLRPCPGCAYEYIDDDVRYVHEDVRRSPFGIESMSTGALGWAGEIDPFGNWKAIGLPGADGKIGTADDEPLAFGNHTSAGKSRFEPVDQLAALAGRGSAWARPSTGDRLGGPSGAQKLLGQITQGLSPYLAGHESGDALAALGGKRGTLKSDGNLMGRGRRDWGSLANGLDDFVNSVAAWIGAGTAAATAAEIITGATATAIAGVAGAGWLGYQVGVIVGEGANIQAEKEVKAILEGNSAPFQRGSKILTNPDADSSPLVIFGAPPTDHKSWFIKPGNPGAGDVEPIDLSATPSAWLKTIGGWTKVDKTKAYVDTAMNLPGNGAFNGIPGSELPDHAPELP